MDTPVNTLNENVLKRKINLDVLDAKRQEARRIQAQKVGPCKFQFSSVFTLFHCASVSCTGQIHKFQFLHSFLFQLGSI